MVSLNPDTFSHPVDHTITARQAALLKAKGIEAGISDGRDEHWIEDWLRHELDIDVADVEELLESEFKRVLEWLQEAYGI